MGRAMTAESSIFFRFLNRVELIFFIGIITMTFVAMLLRYVFHIDMDWFERLLEWLNE